MRLERGDRLCVEAGGERGKKPPTSARLPSAFNASDSSSAFCSASLSSRGGLGGAGGGAGAASGSGGGGGASSKGTAFGDAFGDTFGGGAGKAGFVGDGSSIGVGSGTRSTFSLRSALPAPSAHSLTAVFSPTGASSTAMTRSSTCSPAVAAAVPGCTAQMMLELFILSPIRSPWMTGRVKARVSLSGMTARSIQVGYAEGVMRSRSVARGGAKLWTVRWRTAGSAMST